MENSRLHAPRAADFSQTLDDLITAATDLPTMPAILWEIQAALQNINNSSAEVAAVIEQDPSLAARILRLANSSYFGARSSVASIKDAVTHVGRKEVEQIASTTVIIDSFSSQQGALDYEQFWIHSLQVAETAMLLADQNPMTSPFLASEAYIPGLIHDVGKLLLDQCFPKHLAAVRAYQKSHAVTDAEAERAVLGMDHGEIAARLMDTWNLAPAILEAIRWHHAPGSCEDEYRPYAEAIERADILCHAVEAGNLPQELLDHPVLPLDEETAERLRANLENAKERALLLLN